MKLLLDQGLPRSAAEHLQSMVLAAEHVGALGLAAATDELILAETQLRGGVVVTLDADSHVILARSGAASPSVIRIRAEGLYGGDCRTAHCPSRANS
jgi:predicted nuclease of predicted toxin-antitoxin system